MGNMFWHDGHWLETCGDDEWGMQRAIDNYENEKKAILADVVRREIRRMTGPKQGHWIIAKIEEGLAGVAIVTKQCSECGYFHSLAIPDAFCPKCGSHNEGRYEPCMEAVLHEFKKRWEKDDDKQREQSEAPEECGPVPD